MVDQIVKPIRSGDYMVLALAYCMVQRAPSPEDIRFHPKASRRYAGTSKAYGALIHSYIDSLIHARSRENLPW